MKYLYEYKYKNGCKIGGHNLEEMQTYKEIIILKGTDTFPNDDYEQHYWVTKLNMNKIEYLKIEPIQKDDD